MTDDHVLKLWKMRVARDAVRINPKLGRAALPKFHELKRDVARDLERSGIARNLLMEIDEGLRVPLWQIFLVEHHWADAFAGSGIGSALADIRLPFPACVFEFQVSGLPCCVCVKDDDAAISWVAWVKTLASGWTPFSPIGGQQAFELDRLIVATIRAICVAFDADIVVSSTVRARKPNNAAVRRGALPLPEYRIVKLKPRSSRASPVLSSESDTSKRRSPRLHFRRGYRRRSGVWVKWSLVGKPDLGFIDKHYRLGD